MTPNKRTFAKFGITHEAVLDAIDEAMQSTGNPTGCRGRHRISGRGLCSCFLGSQADIFGFLKSIGGKSSFSYRGHRECGFWHDPEGPHWREAQEQRLMMLAFMYEWTKP